MNTHTEYRRHGYRPPDPTVRSEDGEAATSALTHHRDPSLAIGRNDATPQAKGVAWIRPTELAAYAAPMIGRGIDLQAELIRHARRSPTTTTRALERSLSHPAPPKPPSANRTEGPSL